MFAYCQQYISGGFWPMIPRVIRNSALIKMNKVIKIPDIAKSIQNTLSSELGYVHYKRTLELWWIKITNTYFLFTVFLVSCPMWMSKDDLWHIIVTPKLRLMRPHLNTYFHSHYDKGQTIVGYILNPVSLLWIKF